ncbi:hypothetical protein [Stenotrophomonas sp. PE591]|uniref:hypothetical protein n=1 Tax=Stenotrophomonas sp. PE591 TaxID=1812490 RepID=UPI001BAF3488|nr:hypothetical protein [Stenotrophomonas sp. PE591]
MSGNPFSGASRSRSSHTPRLDVGCPEGLKGGASGYCTPLIPSLENAPAESTLADPGFDERFALGGRKMRGGQDVVDVLFDTLRWATPPEGMHGIPQLLLYDLEAQCFESSVPQSVLCAGKFGSREVLARCEAMGTAGNCLRRIGAPSNQDIKMIRIPEIVLEERVIAAAMRMARVPYARCFENM